MQKGLFDLMKSFKDLMQLDRRGLLGVKNKSEVYGWLKGYSVKKPFNGEGCLVFFKYTNIKNNKQVMYYACSDNLVSDLLSTLVMKLVTKTETIIEDLVVMAYSLFMNEFSDKKWDWNDWQLKILVKADYDAIPKDKGKFDLSHLSTTEGFTVENMMDDMNEVRMRGINMAQFIAEQCMVLVHLEKQFN